jgi:L-asparagine transporter-like permease
MTYRPPQRRNPAPPWLWAIVIIVFTLIFAWLAGPRDQATVIAIGVIFLVAYLGLVFFLRWRRRDNDADL